MAAATPLHTPAPINVHFPTSSGTDCPGYLSDKNRDSEAGLVVIQEWWGMNKAIQKTCDGFSVQGFRAVVPDLYRGKVAQNKEQAGHLLGGLDFPKAVSDIVSAAQYLKSIGVKKVGVVGFCMGGALAIASAASSRELDAAACFYGVPDLSKFNASNVKMPVQLHFGKFDDAKGFSDLEAANRLEKWLKDAGVSVELNIYDAGHAFHNSENPEAYVVKAAEEADAKTVAFFRKYLSGTTSNVPTGPNAERTFIAIKPDGVQRGLVGEVISRFERKGYQLVAMKFVQITKQHAEKHYFDLREKPFYRGLVDYVTSGPVVAMVWQGKNSVKGGRVLVGATNPADAAPGTFRGDFALDVGRNVIHGSDSVENANKEISLWFNENELFNWAPSDKNWIYEKP